MPTAALICGVAILVWFFATFFPGNSFPNSFNEYEIQSLSYVSKHRRGRICGCDLMCNTPTDGH